MNTMLWPFWSEAVYSARVTSNMRYYIEIKLLHNSEIGLGFLWKKVYTQVHLALAERGGGAIGASFPDYGDKLFPLGDSLRLFSPSENELEALQISRWLERLQDYVTVSGIEKVPENVEGYAQFIRKQVKTGKERQARRFAKRHGIGYEEALKRYESMEEKTLALPFIMLQSLSSNQEMKLFIDKKAVDKELGGDFNSYGFSKDATVPWF